MLRQTPSIASPRALVGVAIDVASSYGRGVLRGVTRFANLQRRWVLHEDLRLQPETLVQWPTCDGAVIAGVGGSAAELIRARSRFTISCSGSMDPAYMPVVALDDDAAGVLAAEHLSNCRLEHFAFYGKAVSTSVAPRRLAGFNRTLQAQGHQCVESPVLWPSGLDLLTHTHRPKLVEWLETLPKPVGILCADDTVAHDLASTCLEANIGVPDQVAILGINNDDILCESAWPPLSSIECDYSRMGYLAAKMLDRMLAGEVLPDSERELRLPPLGVVQRQSTSTLAIADPNLSAAIRYIREHACDPCTVDDLLRVVPVNRRWLERQFSSQIGRTPHDEIIRIRVETARRLLLQPDLSIPEIARRCGMSATQNFERTFRKATGTTPAAYRKTALRGTKPDR